MAQVKIEITFDPATETAEQALAAFKTFTNKTEEAKAPAAKAPKTTTAKTETEAPVVTEGEQMSLFDTVPEETATAEAPTEKPISKTDIRATATALSKTNKPALKAIFDSFGVAKLSDIPEDKYPELMRKMVEANA